MQLPKRTIQHITETASWKIMQSKLPNHWIVRELTERDYGIDAYVELVTPNGEVTGDVCSIQLKGTQSINWTKTEGRSHSYTKVHIPMTTVNYWWNTPMPVFLVLADIVEQRAFFTPVKIQARVQHRIFNRSNCLLPSTSPSRYVALENGVRLRENLANAYGQGDWTVKDLAVSRAICGACYDLIPSDVRVFTPTQSDYQHFATGAMSAVQLMTPWLKR